MDVIGGRKAVDPTHTHIEPHRIASHRNLRSVVIAARIIDIDIVAIMGKGSKASPSRQPMNMRVAYLHRISQHLHSSLSPNNPAPASTPNIARTYLSHMRSISRKSNLRLPPHIKSTTCRRCEAFCAAPSDLEGRSGGDNQGQQPQEAPQKDPSALRGTATATATETIENASKRGNKKWADVRVKTCATCGAQRRFPTADRTVQREKKTEKKRHMADAS